MSVAFADPSVAGPKLKFGILGPLTLHLDGRAVALGPHKQQQILAMLLCRANSVASVDTLTDVLWGDEPPRTARKNLQVYVACLRKLLGSDGKDDRLSHRNGGYVLRVATDEVDLLEFHQRVSMAHGAADPAGVVTGLRAALDLWRGGLLDGLTATPAIGGEADRMQLKYLGVFEDWAEGEIALGNVLGVVDEIRGVAESHPFRERLRQLEMTALYRAGRRAEALSVFDELRHGLARELGLRPGPATEKVYRSMLGGDPAIGRTTRPAEPARPPVVLPPDTAEFTGRAEPLRRLEALTAAGQPRRVVLVSGAMGVGKTALAVHAAWRAERRFPDGRLFLNARTEHATPRSVNSVLRELVRYVGLAVPEGSDSDELAGRWQHWLMNRQVLLTLDDVCDNAVLQAVVPLSPGSMVIATSRHLAGADGAAQVELLPMEPAEAVDLLIGTVEAGRVAADLPAALRIVQVVGLTPLAIRAVGAQLTMVPQLRLADLAGRLEASGELLHELSCAAQGGMRGRLAASVAELTDDERSALRQLAAISSATFTEEQAVGALSEALGRARRLLESLIEVHAVIRSTAEVAAHAAVYELPVLLRCFIHEAAAG